MLKKPKSFVILSVTVFLISLASGAFVSWLLLKKESLDFLPTGIELIPDKAVFVASVSTDSQQWQELQQLGNAEVQKSLQQPLTQLQKSLDEIGIDFSTEIKPWLGKEVAIANLGDFYIPQTVFILPIEHLEEIQLFWNKFESKIAKKATYQTIPIYSISTPNEQTYFISRLNKYAVVASDIKAIEKVIDTYQGDVSLLALPGFKKAFNQIQGKQIFARFYFNFPATLDLIARGATKASLTNFSEPTPQGIATTVTLSQNQLKLSNILWNKPTEKTEDSLKTLDKRMASYLPNNTRLVVAGGNAANFWDGFMKESQILPIMPIQPKQIQELITTTTGLEWEKDFLPWMKDNFSVALVPNVATEKSILEGALVLMVEVSDRTLANATLEKVHKVLENRYQFQRKTTQASGKSVTNWRSPLGGVTATEGWISHDILFFTLGAPVTSSFFPQPQANLKQNLLFSQTLDTPQPSNSQLFLDLENLLKADSAKFLQLSPQQQSWLNSIRSIGLTTTIPNAESRRIDMIMQLKSMPNQTGKQLER